MRLAKVDRNRGSAPYAADGLSFLFASLARCLSAGQPFLQFVLIFGSHINVIGAAFSLVFIAVVTWTAARRGDS